MVKQTNIYFDDDEYVVLMARKEELGLNWHDFVMTLVQNKEDKNAST